MNGIYLMEFTNGDIYIGRSIDIKRRIKRHRDQLKNNKHCNRFLQNVYNKHGDFEYRVLEEVPNEHHGDREKYWISVLTPTLNLTEGGDGGEVLTEEEKSRRKSEVYTDQYRKNMSTIMTGKKRDESVGKKISESRKKLYDDPERKKWLIENSGIHNSKGYLNQKLRGDSPNAKKVINIETGEVFDCLKDVSEKFNINYKSLITRLSESRRKNTTPFRYLINNPNLGDHI
jgi:group I intron endonuclease